MNSQMNAEIANTTAFVVEPIELETWSAMRIVGMLLLVLNVAAMAILTCLGRRRRRILGEKESEMEAGTSMAKKGADIEKGLKDVEIVISKDNTGTTDRTTTHSSSNEIEVTECIEVEGKTVVIDGKTQERVNKKRVSSNEKTQSGPDGVKTAKEKSGAHHVVMRSETVEVSLTDGEMPTSSQAKPPEQRKTASKKLEERAKKSSTTEAADNPHQTIVSGNTMRPTGRTTNAAPHPVGGTKVVSANESRSSNTGQESVSNSTVTTSTQSSKPKSKMTRIKVARPHDTSSATAAANSRGRAALATDGGVDKAASCYLASDNAKVVDRRLGRADPPISTRTVTKKKMNPSIPEHGTRETEEGGLHGEGLNNRERFGHNANVSTKSKAVTKTTPPSASTQSSRVSYVNAVSTGTPLETRGHNVDDPAQRLAPATGTTTRVVSVRRVSSRDSSDAREGPHVSRRKPRSSECSNVDTVRPPSEAVVHVGKDSRMDSSKGSNRRLESSKSTMQPKVRKIQADQSQCTPIVSTREATAAETARNMNDQPKAEAQELDSNSSRQQTKKQVTKNTTDCSGRGRKQGEMEATTMKPGTLPKSDTSADAKDAKAVRDGLGPDTNMPESPTKQVKRTTRTTVRKKQCTGSQNTSTERESNEFPVSARLGSASNDLVQPASQVKGNRSTDDPSLRTATDDQAANQCTTVARPSKVSKKPVPKKKSQRNQKATTGLEGRTATSPKTPANGDLPSKSGVAPVCTRTAFVSSDVREGGEQEVFLE